MSSFTDKIALAGEIRKQIEEMAAGDPDVIRDTLEGECDIFQIIDWIIGKIADEEGFADSITARVDGLKARMDACKARRENLRGLLQMAVEATGERSLRRPEATVSLTALKPGIASIDEAVLPDQFFKTERRVDRTAILNAMKDGEVVPGVVMGNGGTSVTVRRK